MFGVRMFKFPKTLSLMKLTWLSWITVIIQVLPCYSGFTKTPISVDVETGKEAVFQCQLESALFIHWKVNGTFLGQDAPPGITQSTDHDQDGLLVNTLTILGQVDFNSTTVQCVATFRNGSTETSPPATLTITDSIMVFHVLRGETMYIECYCPNVIVQWAINAIILVGNSLNGLIVVQESHSSNGSQLHTLTVTANRNYDGKTINITCFSILNGKRKLIKQYQVLVQESLTVSTTEGTPAIVQPTTVLGERQVTAETTNQTVITDSPDQSPTLEPVIIIIIVILLVSAIVVVPVAVILSVVCIFTCRHRSTHKIYNPANTPMTCTPRLDTPVDVLHGSHVFSRTAKSNTTSHHCYANSVDQMLTPLQLAAHRPLLVAGSQAITTPTRIGVNHDQQNEIGTTNCEPKELTIESPEDLTPDTTIPALSSLSRRRLLAPKQLHRSDNQQVTDTTCNQQWQLRSTTTLVGLEQPELIMKNVDVQNPGSQQ